MRIFIDADSCPRQIRNVIAKGAMRLKVEAGFIANRKIPFPGNSYTYGVVVKPEEGSADKYILQKARPGDLVITRDIPLAAELVEREILVLNVKGEVFTRENIRERLSLRDFMKDLRESGLPAPEKDTFGEREIRNFANTFDRESQKLLKKDQAK